MHGRDSWAPDTFYAKPYEHLSELQFKSGTLLSDACSCLEGQDKIDENDEIEINAVSLFANNEGLEYAIIKSLNPELSKIPEICCRLGYSWHALRVRTTHPDSKEVYFVITRIDVDTMFIYQPPTTSYQHHIANVRRHGPACFIKDRAAAADINDQITDSYNYWDVTPEGLKLSTDRLLPRAMTVTHQQQGKEVISRMGVNFFVQNVQKQPPTTFYRLCAQAELQGSHAPEKPGPSYRQAEDAKPQSDQQPALSLQQQSATTAVVHQQSTGEI